MIRSITRSVFGLAGSERGLAANERGLGSEPPVEIGY